MRVAVIGAGPSGLVTLKYLLDARDSLRAENIQVRLFESDAGVGGTFLSRTWEGAELVSSKQLTTFSDFRLEDEADFPTAKRYIRYLNDYCTHFKLWPHIKFSCRVEHLTRSESDTHILSYVIDGQKHIWECDAVAVCSGLHVEPNIPQLEGIERVPVTLHSSEFKSRKQFGTGNTVLILGSGETSSDISFLAVTSPTNRVVTNPNPKLIFSRPRKPSARPQVPIDVSRASLFDTAYVHPWLRNSDVLWNYYDLYIRWICWLSWGTTHGHDQWIGGKPDGWSGSEIFFNKAVDTPVRYTDGRHIDVAPWPDYIDEDGIVHFRDNGRPEHLAMKDQKIKPDVLIFCTGYKQTLPFLNGSPSDADVRGIWRRDDPTVGFIGFMRPNLGAIPPLAEMQAQLWVLNLLAPERVGRLLPQDEPHYRLVSKKNARIRYGVDHESYAYQLALDMNAAPSFWDMVRMSLEGPGWKLTLTWALGANFTTKFRLCGPWKWDGAADVMTGELWDTVARRELFFGHFTLSIFPILIFGPLSLVVFLIASLSGLFDRLFRKPAAQHKLSSRSM
ncbi:hypothetical protein DL766_007150 [Monosporascus sp. MC13-8B]|uniref:Dimethylaniline monooxygenase n=1 Tax=Monosporascus cannonballus TaxID=155416 RepID=A0ABY0H2Y5_9PEZI|nr:hypothetical protein DL762_007661 [Monosporascus cannonballus]RYO99397.1 hypothetical protein DL763_001571 [Monosporascus cannonballus]RYP25057.1 hypothetical protein DL766_007150 [Monosporascus sp. MC13-8B]